LKPPYRLRRPYPYTNDENDQDKVVDDGIDNGNDDSFEILDNEIVLKKSWKNSEITFNMAEQKLLNDVQQSNSLVEKISMELDQAKQQNDACIERHRNACLKRNVEIEAYIVQTLHLEILNKYIGQNEKARQLLLDDEKHSINGGILGQHRNLRIQQQQQQQQQQQEQSSSSSSSTSDLNSSFASTQPGLIKPGIRHSINNINNQQQKQQKQQQREQQEQEQEKQNNPYENKSVEELRVIKNRLIMIKDLFTKPQQQQQQRNYSTDSSALSSSLSEDEEKKKKQQQQQSLLLQQQQQGGVDDSQIRVENATSKYILFRNRNLI
jgi:hypothetical protein